MCAGFYAMTLVSSGLAGRHTATAKIAVTALLLFTFPWWDSFMLFDVMFNYVWSSALVLAVLWLLLRGVPSRWRWGRVGTVGVCCFDARRDRTAGVGEVWWCG